MANSHSCVPSWSDPLVAQGPTSRWIVPTSWLMNLGVKKSTFRAGPGPTGWWMCSGGWFYFLYSDRGNSAGFWECELYLLLRHAVYHHPLHHPFSSVQRAVLAWKGFHYVEKAQCSTHQVWESDKRKGIHKTEALNGAFFKSDFTMCSCLSARSQFILTPWY